MANNKRLIAEIISNDKVIMTIDNNLLSAEVGALDRGSLTDVVDWGIYANRGSLSFIDNMGYFNNSNVNSPEIKSAKVRFYLAKNTMELIATFDVANCDFNDATRQVDMELQSHLLSWENTYTKLPIYIYDTSNFFTVLDHIVSNIAHGDTTVIGNLNLFCCYFDMGTTVWNIINQLCQAGMCRVYDNKYGEPVISNTFSAQVPIIIDVDNVITYSNNDFVAVKNPTIDVIPRTKHTRPIDESIITFNVYEYRRLSSNTFDIELSPKNNGAIVTETKIATGIYSADVTINIPFPHKMYGIFESLTRIKKDIFVHFGTTNERYLVDDDYTRFSEYRYQISGTHDSIHFTFAIPNALLDAREESALANVEYVTNATLMFYPKYFKDGEIETITRQTDESTLVTQINSNDLIQTQNFVGDIPQANYILDEISKRYSNGIECVECECLFNNYYDTEGNLVLDGSQLQHFERYNIVIPYTVKRGQRVPFRTNADGTPKQFRIIGIQYSYDGLLKQKLWLQEERYDDIA